jgi:iron complex transport system substrate-binding protein
MRWLAGCVFALFGWAALPALAQYNVQDDQGRDVHFDRAPVRVITLIPSLTETVCALGACDRLVATDRFSDWPASVAQLPKAGGLDDTQIELIARLRPDVVLLSRSARVVDRLQQLGLKTVVVEVDSFDGIARAIRLVAQVLGVPARAGPLNDQIQRGVEAVARAARATGPASTAPAATPASAAAMAPAPAPAPAPASPPSVYFEVDTTPYAAGEASFIGDLLSRLGVRNIVPAALGPFPKLNPEYVVRANPDVIFVSPTDAPWLAGRPGWAGIRAVREHRLCSLDRQALNAVVRPGPRVVEGIRALADCLKRVAP